MLGTPHLGMLVAGAKRKPNKVAATKKRKKKSPKKKSPTKPKKKSPKRHVSKKRKPPPIIIEDDSTFAQDQAFQSGQPSQASSLDTVLAETQARLHQLKQLKRNMLEPTNPVPTTSTASRINEFNKYIPKSPQGSQTMPQSPTRPGENYQAALALQNAPPQQGSTLARPAPINAVIKRNTVRQPQAPPPSMPPAASYTQASGLQPIPHTLPKPQIPTTKNGLDEFNKSIASIQDSGASNWLEGYSSMDDLRAEEARKNLNDVTQDLQVATADADINTVASLLQNMPAGSIPNVTDREQKYARGQAKMMQTIQQLQQNQQQTAPQQPSQGPGIIQGALVGVGTVAAKAVGNKIYNKVFGDAPEEKILISAPPTQAQNDFSEVMEILTGEKSKRAGEVWKQHGDKSTAIEVTKKDLQGVPETDVPVLQPATNTLGEATAGATAVEQQQTVSKFQRALGGFDPLTQTDANATPPTHGEMMERVLGYNPDTQTGAADCKKQSDGSFRCTLPAGKTAAIDTAAATKKVTNNPAGTTDAAANNIVSQSESGPDNSGSSDGIIQYAKKTLGDASKYVTSTVSDATTSVSTAAGNASTYVTGSASNAYDAYTGGDAGGVSGAAGNIAGAAVAGLGARDIASIATSGYNRFLGTTGKSQSQKNIAALAGVAGAASRMIGQGKFLQNVGEAGVVGRAAEKAAKAVGVGKNAVWYTKQGAKLLYMARKYGLTQNMIQTAIQQGVDNPYKSLAGAVAIAAAAAAKKAYNYKGDKIYQNLAPNKKGIIAKGRSIYRAAKETISNKLNAFSNLIHNTLGGGGLKLPAGWEFIGYKQGIPLFHHVPTNMLQVMPPRGTRIIDATGNLHAKYIPFHKWSLSLKGGDRSHIDPIDARLSQVLSPQQLLNLELGITPDLDAYQKRIFRDGVLFDLLGPDRLDKFGTLGQVDTCTTRQKNAIRCMVEGRCVSGIKQCYGRAYAKAGRMLN